MCRSVSARRGPKRLDRDELGGVQEANQQWWAQKPMTHDWSSTTTHPPRTLPWFDEQDRLSANAHGHFATVNDPLDQLIPYDQLAEKDVLEIGIGSGSLGSSNSGTPSKIGLTFPSGSRSYGAGV